MNNRVDFSRFFSSPELLANAILEQYRNEVGELEFPINPFRILKNLDVKIVLKKFKNLEGLYLPAKDSDDVDIVAINIKRNIHRQRFTAAHEICHCIKDKNNTIICPISGKKNNIERFADNFASFLLMPTMELEKQVKKYTNKNGFIKFEDIIYVSEYFGVSFESCVFRIAYGLKMIEGNTDSAELKKKVKKIKPDKLREQFGTKNILKLKRELVDDYFYARPKNKGATNIKFISFLNYNENRLEGVNIDENKLNYILADIRLNNDFSKYESETDQNILEALGNIELIDYVLNTNENIEVWRLQKMQKILYKYTPFGNEMVFPRQSDNRISGAKISTVDCNDIFEELVKVNENIKCLINKMPVMSIHEYVLEAIKIHYRLTVIHPLNDGNGRCCRAMLLWLLRLKNLPPLYIRSENKPKYIEALSKIDTTGNYDYLEILIIDQLLESIVLLDEKLEL